MTVPCVSTSARTCRAERTLRHDPATPAPEERGRGRLLVGEPGLLLLGAQTVERRVRDGSRKPGAVPIQAGEAHDCPEPGPGVLHLCRRNSGYITMSGTLAEIAGNTCFQLAFSGGATTASPRTSSQPWNTSARPVNRTVGYSRSSVSSDR